LAAEVEDVSKTPCRDEADSGSAPLDDCVGDQSRPMNDAGNFLCPHAARHESLDGGPDSQPWVLRCGQHLLDHHGAARVVDRREVGEGSSDVDAEPHLVGLRCASTSSRVSGSTLTPYSLAARSAVTSPFRTSTTTASKSRSAGSPTPPPPAQ